MTAQAGDTLFPVSAAPAKAALRSVQRRLRSSITRSEKTSASRQAVRALLRYLPPHCEIAIYLSVRSELSTLPLRTALLRQGHQVYAPVTLRDRRLRFVRLHGHSPLRRSILGLPQPVRTRGARAARNLDVILLPLLAFDARGARLGNGGGYYDRALAGPRVGQRPWRVGYAYAAQEVATVPCEAFDVLLDAVVTERGLRRFGRAIMSTPP